MPQAIPARSPPAAIARVDKRTGRYYSRRNRLARSKFSSGVDTVLTVPRKKALPTRLTRQEAKRRTRARLLESARQMVLAGNESRLSAKAVATKAGVGGATFYEHFRNLQELLRPPAHELFDALPEDLRERPRQAS